MNEKTLALLEFGAIRSRVAEAALSGEAARLILETSPLTDPREVGELKDMVREFLDRLGSGDDEPREGLPDIGSLFPALGVKGMSLAPEEAYALGIFLDRAGAMKRWILPDKGDKDGTAGPDSLESNTLREQHTPAACGGAVDFSRGKPSPLRALVSRLPDCTPVSREIFRVLDRDGKIRDLPELREIRRRIRTLIGELEAVSAGYAGNEELRRMLQSTLPSQRDGRLALAVKANSRNRVRGIVHEVSSSGQTVFVEPEEVVEKNNELLIENRRLDTEIRRIFRDMTGRIAEYRQALEEFHRGILYLETLRARARYGYETRGCLALDGGPAGSSGITALKKARHPLLGASAVPIDFTMDVRTVIITGPNTGGKTVALKTLGLFALMNQAGLALPAEDAVLPVFDGVYADIGDEQSLSQSLSTFSAHMINIAAIIENAGAGSLVLLDELGSGTDPEEGSAIAMAILDHLIAKKVRLVVTTHHGLLKNYGYTREGVENASVEFDGRTLSPTYRIVMGIPGESRAVDIAERTGLPASVVRTARGYLDEERSDVSALISSLKRKHRELDAAEETRKAEAERLREERRLADLKELRLRQKEAELKAGGMGNLRRLLSESRKTLENLVREVKEGELSREKTVKVKEFLRDLEETVAAEGAALEEEDRRLAEARLRLDGELPAFSGGRAGIPIGPGTEVLAGEQRRRGRVLRADKKASPKTPSWIVEIGSLKMSFPEKDLVPLPPSAEEKKAVIAPVDLVENRARFEINLRGMRLEEALETLGRQIDAAVLAGLREFSVIHGKGDGVLQRGVHEYLKTQALVADYYFSRPELGGFGRTEVILRE
jgi:DNA mismatch repair protein MutS2